MKKTMLITGTSSGLGKVLANYYKSRYNLVLCCRSHKQKLEKSNLLMLPCDVTKKEQVNDAVTAAIAKFSGIDILINNAGLMKFSILDLISEQDIDNMYNTNVRGPLFFIQACLPSLEHRAGYIINIGSVRSIATAPNKVAYSATKFALRAINEGTNLENFSFYGIRSTLICPGKFGNRVTTKDVAKTIDFLLSLDKNTLIREIIIGGQL